MYFLKSKQANYGIDIPTSIDEYTPEILNEITKNIILRPYNMVVAVILKVKLYDLFMSLGTKHNGVVNVIPLIAKINDADIKQSSIGTRCLIPISIIENAIQVPGNISISRDNVCKYALQHPDVKTECINKRYTGNLESLIASAAFTQKDIEIDNAVKVCLVSLKVLPTATLSGYIDNFPINDRFTIVNKVNSPFIALPNNE